MRRSFEEAGEGVRAASAVRTRLRRRPSPAVWVLVAIVIAGALWATIALLPTAGSPPPAGSAGATDAAAVLASLEVKGRAPRTGYDREQFGQRWFDADENGCDTRNDILARDLTALERSGRCTVVSGSLHDPYTGRDIAFVRGRGTSERVQIDHVVALSDAWQTGAQLLDAARRAQLANDPLNLLAVDGPTNAQKSDGDAATWLPGNKSFRCAYVARQIAVKAGYGLWVTPAERDAMAGVLDSCPGEQLPTRGG